MHMDSPRSERTLVKHGFSQVVAARRIRFLMVPRWVWFLGECFHSRID